MKGKETNEEVLEEILAIIRRYPGIRPSEINRRLNRVQSDSLRATLIRRGLVRKVKDGKATHLYPIQDDSSETGRGQRP